MQIIYNAIPLIVSVGLIFAATRILRFPVTMIKLYEEAHRLYRRRYIVGVDKARLELNTFIKENTQRIYLAGILVLFSYVVMIYDFSFVVKGPHPSPFWQIALLVFIIFAYPIVFLFILPLLEMKKMKNYIDEKFSGELEISGLESPENRK